MHISTGRPWNSFNLALSFAFMVVFVLHLWIVGALVRNQLVRADGQIVTLLGDDALISMTYARNLANGHGLTWTAGERVEGFSNLLWTLYMALVHLLHFTQLVTGLVVIVTCWLFTALSAAVAGVLGFYLVAKSCGNKPAAVAAAAVAAGTVLLNFSFLTYAVAGFETALCGLLLSGAVYAWLRKFNYYEMAMAGMLALLVLARAEFAGLLLLLLAAGFVAIPSDRKVLGISFVAVAFVFGCLTAWRYKYFGELLPNTYYLKVYRFPHRWANGLQYLQTYLLGGGGLLLIILSIFWCRRIVAAGAAAIFLVLFTVYIGYLGGDAFPLFRLLDPVLPLASALAAAAIFTCAQSLVRPVPLLLGSLLVLPVFTNAHSFPYVINFLTTIASVGHDIPARRGTENVELANWINSHTTEDCSVGVIYAGAMGYFCNRPLVDMLGKCEPRIARLPAHETGLPGHNKFDFDYIATRRAPDLILAEQPLAADCGGSPPAALPFWQALSCNAHINELYEPVNDPSLKSEHPVLVRKSRRRAVLKE